VANDRDHVSIFYFKFTNVPELPIMDKTALNDKIEAINLEYYEVLHFCIYRIVKEIKL